MQPSTRSIKGLVPLPPDEDTDQTALADVEAAYWWVQYFISVPGSTRSSTSCPATKRTTSG